MKAGAMKKGVAMSVVMLVAVVLLAADVPVGQAAQGTVAPQGRAVIDVSGVDMFLEVTALLEQEKEPTPAQWERLFATPGYAALIEREFSRDFFADRFRMAFMPSKKAELDAQMKKDAGLRAQILPHYVRARASRAEIERRVAELRTAEFADEAIGRARRLLPRTIPDARPSIAFVVFAPDSRGYDPVVIDILYLTDHEGFLNTIAHEFHHWYRARLAPDLTRDQDILWVIQQVQLEGIADLINVPAWMSRPADSWSPLEREFVEIHRRSPEIIRAMDDLFARMGDHPADRRDLGATLRRTVPRSGHPTGYFMATTIVEAFGTDRLVRTVPNPFAFFLLYGEAAATKRGSAPPFSRKAVEFIRSLEKRYLE